MPLSARPELSTRLRRSGRRDGRRNPPCEVDSGCAGVGRDTSTNRRYLAFRVLSRLLKNASLNLKVKSEKLEADENWPDSDFLTSNFLLLTLGCRVFPQPVRSCGRGKVVTASPKEAHGYRTSELLFICAVGARPRDCHRPRIRPVAFGIERLSRHELSPRPDVAGRRPRLHVSVGRERTRRRVLARAVQRRSGSVRAGIDAQSGCALARHRLGGNGDARRSDL